MMFWRLHASQTMMRALLLGLCCSLAVKALVCPKATTHAPFSSSSLRVTQDSWSISDDWSTFSSEYQDNAHPDTDTIFNQDLAFNAAREFEAAGTATLSEEDLWISDVVDEIYNYYATLDDPPLYDIAIDKNKQVTKTESIDDMGDELAMLIRCNERPENMLVTEGRALPPLTDAEKDDVSQLVVLTESSTCEATEFLRASVSKMFQRHATPDKTDDVLSLDRAGVAKWMTQSLRSERPVSAHEKRVLQTISEFSSYGSGRLVEEELQSLYLSTIVGDISKLGATTMSPARHLQLRKPFIDAVWRDIRNHYIISPVEQERKQLAEEIHAKNGVTTASSVGGSVDTIMDECEILDWDYRPDDEDEDESLSPKRQASGKKSSSKTIELANDKKTPLYVRDGEFVFIDEESCIGCMQCVNVSPDSFLMLDGGRARTFNQRNSGDVHQAVASCPVSCMHPVSYKELKEYETARDEGDGRTDHKHLGHQRGMTPLHVAGMDSDNNHRTSWFHTLKNKCVVSGACPQKGCYDCPKYNKPGANPYFKKQHQEAEHARAQHFLDNGDVDIWRKTADL